MKMVLILSYGNAFAEQGFLINKEIPVKNLNEQSLIVQRQVYDMLKYHGGGIEEIEIKKGMILTARNAHGLYKEAYNKKQIEKKLKGERKSK